MADATPGSRDSFTGHPRKVRAQSFRERSMLIAGARQGLWSGLSVSVGAHVLVFGGALLYAHLTPPRTVPEKPIVAKLVRLGKPRDEKLLPRLPAAPPPAPTPAPVEVPVVAPQQPPAAPQQPSTAKTLDVPRPAPKVDAAAASSEALERQKRMMEALSRLGPPAAGPTGKVVEELPGQADGDPRGDADEAAEGDRYLALVQLALRQNYAVPTIISDKERLYLKCKLFLKIAPNGKIDSYRITEPSGNAHFDRAVEASLQRAVLPPPPPAFLRTYGEDGLEIGFKP